MNDNANENVRRNKIIRILTDALPVLRARIGASQAEISNRIGVSRQTYCSIENRKKDMNWTICVALFAVFCSNEDTRKMIKLIEGLKDAVINELRV